MMEINEEFIINNANNFELISVSSNRVYRFEQGNKKYILKVNNISADNLSPFWHGIKEIFSSDFDMQRENMNETLSMLKNPHIQAAQLISKSHKNKFQIFEEVDGRSYEPDEFPDNDEIEYQLGQFIGCIHGFRHDYFGNPKIIFILVLKKKWSTRCLK